jgi:hypothetical protein
VSDAGAGLTTIILLVPEFTAAAIASGFVTGAIENAGIPGARAGLVMDAHL